MNKVEYDIKTHLTFIENNITRMANHSFQAKAWCITILTAMNSILFTQNNLQLRQLAIYLSCFVILMFAIIDSYYLYLERGFRKVYDLAIKGDIEPYSMIIPKEQRGIYQYCKAFLSISTGLLYIFMIIGVLILYCNLCTGKA